MQIGDAHYDVSVYFTLQKKSPEVRHVDLEILWPGYYNYNNIRSLQYALFIDIQF